MDPTFAVCYYFAAACRLRCLLLFQGSLLLENKLKALVNIKIVTLDYMYTLANQQPSIPYFFSSVAYVWVGYMWNKIYWTDRKKVCSNFWGI
jgi:hypothetical protein